MTATADWWAGLPGLSTAATRTEADRLTALACAVRITAPAVTAADGGYTTATNRAETAAEHFADWLADAGSDADARTRRICLCLTSTLAVPDATGWRDILATAKWMLRFIRDT